MIIKGKQVWDQSLEDQRADILADIGLSLFDLLAPKSGERIMDLGCGNRQLTKRVADVGCDVLVVSPNGKTVAGAAELGLKGEVVKVDTLPYKNEFDAVLTSSSLHWMKHLDRVVGGVWRALKPGGRFVGECATQGNVATIVTAVQKILAKRGIEISSLRHWYFPKMDDFQSYLQKRGFIVQSIEVRKSKVFLPGDIKDWFALFANHFPAALDKTERDKFFDEISDFCRPTLYNEKQKKWFINLVRLQFYAIKP